MAGKSGENGWALEVVRGKDEGRRYALDGGELVLGNALAGAPGIDLADQEGSSPKKMAARQARLECSAGVVALRDLGSPGGTFVNRQRVLANQARPLNPGDVIQLGGVQLKLVLGASAATPTPTTPPKPAPAPTPTTAPPTTRPAGPVGVFAFTIQDGPTCRSWDDFLTVSAQRWGSLREELASGRLANFLESIGRRDLLPRGGAAGDLDERLDDWLGHLPTTKPSKPEVEVHPAKLAVKAAAGGGMTRRKLRVTNVGYRLLRASARVEPPSTSWLALGAGFRGDSFETAEGLDLPLEIRVPEVLDRPLHAEVVVEGNGGVARVAVVLEPSTPTGAEPAGFAVEHEPAAIGLGLRERLEGTPTAVRVVSWAAAGLFARALVWIGGSDLIGVAIVLAILGALGGAALALRRGTALDVPSGAFAGAFAGVLGAAVLVAGARAVHVSGGPIVAMILWAALGAGLAALSAVLVPPRREVAP
ncbi:MAG TPA: FHA domain-containing protein [Isosphaeraceae bacterium]|jgi:hypothetical protein|nr:FHA domain-containing protein [Isosphaeraceae bacterium]